MDDPCKPSAAAPWSGRHTVALVALFASLAAVLACFWHSRDWNSASRFLLTYRLAQDGSIEITPFVAANGVLLEHPATRDLASPEPGRYFCDKAPGHSFLGVLPAGVGRWAGLVPNYPNALPAVPYWPGDYWVTLGTSGLALSGSACLVWIWLIGRGIDPVWGMAAGLALVLSTNALIYGTMYYGHVSAGACCLASWCVLDRWPRSIWAGAFAGMLAGLAVATEYTLAVFPFAVLVVVGISAWGRGRFPLAGWLAFLLGGVPLAVALGYYHQMVTGSPFRVPYTVEVEAIFGYHAEGFGLAVGAPRADVLAELLVGPRRGLALYAPILAGAVPGFFLGLGNRPTLAWVALGTFLGLLTINAGFPSWDGGMATGPRFLVPAFPLLSLLVGIWLGWRPNNVFLRWVNGAFKILWAVVAVASSVLLAAFNVAGGRVWPGHRMPIVDYLLPALRERQQEPHLGQWLLDAAGFPFPTAFPGVAVTLVFVGAVAVMNLGLARRCRTVDRQPSHANR